MAQSNPDRRQIWTYEQWLGACVALMTVALAVYGATLTKEFIDMDDDVLVLNNAAAHGLSWANLTQAFTTFDPELYVPFTLLSFQLTHSLAGLQPFAYNVGNLLLHTANACLVLWLTITLTGRRWLGVFVSLVFAVHPLNAETVLWVSARKDLLATGFGLLSLIFYEQSRQQSSASLYWSSIGFFVLGLLSKVSIIMLPVALLLLDWRAERRITVASARRWLVYFGVSVAFGIIALQAKHDVLASTSWLEKLLMAPKSTLFLLQKFALPAELSILYPFTEPITLSSSAFLVPLATVAALGLLVFISLQWSRWIAFCLLAFLITLAPSFGNITRAGAVYVAADHYAYLPGIFLCLLLGAGVLRLYEHFPGRLAWPALSAGSLAIVLTLAVFSRQQAMLWTSNERLFGHTLALYPNSYIAHNNLGNVHWQAGEFSAAIVSYHAALQLKADADLVHSNLAIAYEHQGNRTKAIEAMEQAVSLQPLSAQYYMNLGGILARDGQRERAMEAFRAALALDSQLVISQANSKIQDTRHK